MSRRKSAKSVGFFSKAARMASRTLCLAEGGFSPSTGHSEESSPCCGACGFWITDSSCSDAHAVREPPQGKGRTNEIMKFPGAVKGRRIEINVIVNMGLVGMRTDEELILSLCPAHRRFIADTICFFRRNLPGQERLPDLKAQCPARYGPACLCKVLTFYQKKLGGAVSDRAEMPVVKKIGRWFPLAFPGSGHR